MKTVYLVRHAKAIERDSSTPDFERYLIKQGKNESIVMAKILKGKNAIPDIVLSSPAKRAIETAQIFSKILEYPLKEIKLADAVYEASAKQLMEVISKVNNKYNDLMLFGHEPSLSECAVYLLKDFKNILPKSGVICMEFKKDSWRSISKGQGILKYFDFPPEKVRKSEKFKIIKKNTVNKLNEKIIEALKEVDSDVAKDLTGYVEKMSKKITKHFVKIVKKSNS